MAEHGIAPTIRFGPLHEATFLERPNRYLALVECAGAVVEVHVPDPGRMKDLLVPGCAVHIRDAAGARTGTRRTKYDLVLAACQSTDGSILVSVNSLLPNRLVKEALESRRWSEFARYETVRPEVTHGSSRFDFELSSGDDRCFIEVKSVGMMRDGVGWFPDAVTARGRRHVEELTGMRQSGLRTAVVFVAQRSDVSAIRAADDIDPKFAAALAEAARAGVELIGWRTSVSLAGVSLVARVPVIV